MRGTWVLMKQPTETFRPVKKCLNVFVQFLSSFPPVDLGAKWWGLAFAHERSVIHGQTAKYTFPQFGYLSPVQHFEFSEKRRSGRKENNSRMTRNTYQLRYQLLVNHVPIARTCGRVRASVSVGAIRHNRTPHTQRLHYEHVRRCLFPRVSLHQQLCHRVDVVQQ